MPIVIDGWNLIRSEASDIGDLDALEAASILISYLHKFQLTHNDPIILVFDSRHQFLDIRYQNSPKLKIVPTKDADNYIKSHIDKIPQRQRRNIRVVSSDNSLYYYAKDAYATPIKCEEFWNKLKAKRDL